MKNADYAQNFQQSKQRQFTSVGTIAVVTIAAPTSGTEGVKNHNRKLKQRQQVATEKSNALLVLDIPAPAVPAAVIYWYRERKDAPLHALGAELWVGNDRTAKVEAVHCLGLTEIQIKTLLVRILDGFSQHCGVKLERFRSSVELHPQNCPNRPCPLHSDS